MDGGLVLPPLVGVVVVVSFQIEGFRASELLQLHPYPFHPIVCGAEALCRRAVQLHPYPFHSTVCGEGPKLYPRSRAEVGSESLRRVHPVTLTPCTRSHVLKSCFTHAEMMQLHPYYSIPLLLLILFPVRVVRWRVGGNTAAEHRVVLGSGGWEWWPSHH